MRTSSASSAAEQQEDERGEQELDADDLVIFGEDVFAQETQLGMGVRFGARCHD